MPETADGLRIARELGEAAEALTDRLSREGRTMSEKEASELEEIAEALLEQAAQTRTVAVAELLAGAQVSMAELADETKGAAKTIKTIARLRDAVTVAAALIGLGQAIATRNPSAVKPAFNSLKSVLKEPAMALAKDLKTDVLKKIRKKG